MVDNNLLILWTKNSNVQTLVDAFVNIPPSFINSACLLRSPLDFLHKHIHFFFEEGVKD